MKKASKMICFIVVYLMMTSFFIVTNNVNAQTITAEESTNQASEKPTAEDWKIELDDNIQKDAKEFDFIQKSLASSGLADNGHFLLVTGIVLVILGISGVIIALLYLLF